jgi:hypothetical protein
MRGAAASLTVSAALSNQKLLTVHQIAWALHCTPAAVERLAQSGAFPGAVRIHGVWRIPGRDVARHKVRRPGGPLPNAAVTTPSSRFWCTTLGGELCAGHCVMRQQKSEEELTRDTDSRGLGLTFPPCRTDRCEQGRSIREIVGDQQMVKRRHGHPGWTVTP